MNDPAQNPPHPDRAAAPGSGSGDWTPPNASYPPPKAEEPELVRAARTGDNSSIRELIAAGADPNQAFDMSLDPGAHAYPATPLMVAAGSGDGATAETVRLLLELGADPKIALRGRSAASFACRGLGWNYRPGGDADRLRTLLDAGAPLELAGTAGSRLVADTAGTGDAARLRVLLERGAPARPVWDAEEARREHARISERLATDLALPDMEDLMPEPSGPHSHEIPLHRAAERGCAESITLLLDSGAAVNEIGSSGETALMMARSPAAVQALAAAGADVHATTQFNRDALDEVLNEAWSDGTPSVELLDTAHALLRAGVPLERQDDPGWSRLSYTAFRENPLGVRFLLEAGHPPHGPDDSPLHALCWHWDHDDPVRDRVFDDIIDMLVARGVDVNTQDSHGNTPLHECVSGDGGNAVAARALFRHGADPNTRNHDGHTPLSHLYETHFDYEKMVPVLLEHGANPLVPDERGRTSIDLARARAKGQEPDWRAQHFAESGEPMTADWKGRAQPGDAEFRMIRLMEEAAKKFQP